MELAEFERIRQARANGRRAKKYIDHNGVRVWHQARPNRQLTYPGLTHAMTVNSNTLARPRQMPASDPLGRDSARSDSSYATSKFADTARSEAETPRTERQLRWRTTAGAEWTKVRTGNDLPRLPWRETSTLPRILKHPLCKRRQESFLAAHSADAFQDLGPPTRILEFNNKQTGHWSRVLRGQKY